MALLVLACMVAAAFVGFVVLLTIFKIAFRLVLLPLLLVKWLVGGIVLLIVGPIFAIVGLLLAVVFGAAVIVPLLPFIAAAALIWLLVHAGNRPVAV